VKASGRLWWLTAGALAGAIGALIWAGRPHEAQACTDRYEDYILCTGAVATAKARVPTDGVWMLDYRAGKLLGTVIDRNEGKIVGWAEVDLVSEFGLPPRKDVHFLMTTGMVAEGQAALYVAETTSGKFGVYTMGLRPDGQPGVMIKRHDLVLFRQPAGGN
jgi:hypothetical protein